MSYENPGPTGTFLASTGLRQYQFVALNTAGVLIHPTTNGNSLGVLISEGTTASTGRAGSTTSGYSQTVQWSGVAKVLSGSSAIAIGDLIRAATDGRGSVGTSTACVSGVALGAGVSTSTVSEVISVLLFPMSGTLT
jgi:hypothetical protein